jgi:hypothetical protein
MTVKTGVSRRSGGPAKGKPRLQDESIMGVGFPSQKRNLILLMPSFRGLADGGRPTIAASYRSAVLSVYIIRMNRTSSVILSKSHRDDLL